MSTTRWSARVDAAVALAKGYDAILAALCEISNDVNYTANARVEARGLGDRMDQLETAILTEVWFEILSQFNKISITLQTAGIALNTGVGLLKSLIEFVQQKRDKFDYFEGCGVERVGHEEYGTLELVRKQYYSLGNAFGNLNTSSNRERLSNLNTSSSSDITVAAERLVRAYPEDLERDLSVDLIQFFSFVKSTQDLQTLASKEPNVNELRLFLLLTELSLDQTFPNVYIMFPIYLCMMITNCEGERSFSKLARIKNQLRSTMGQERLVMLTLMSIEHEMLRKLDFSEMIDELAKI